MVKIKDIFKKSSDEKTKSEKPTAKKVTKTSSKGSKKASKTVNKSVEEIKQVSKVSYRNSNKYRARKIIKSK